MSSRIHSVSNEVNDSDRTIINCVSAQSIVAHLWSEKNAFVCGFFIIIIIFFFSFSSAPDNPSFCRQCVRDEHFQAKREEKENLCSISIDSSPIVAALSLSLFLCRWLFLLSALLVSFPMTNASSKQSFISIFSLNLRTRSWLWQKHLLLRSHSFPRDASSNTWSDPPSSLPCHFHRPASCIDAHQHAEPVWSLQRTGLQLIRWRRTSLTNVEDCWLIWETVRGSFLLLALIVYRTGRRHRLFFINESVSSPTLMRLSVVGAGLLLERTLPSIWEE